MIEEKRKNAKNVMLQQQKCMRLYYLSWTFTNVTVTYLRSEIIWVCLK